MAGIWQDHTNQRSMFGGAETLKDVVEAALTKESLNKDKFLQSKMDG
eukprot:gene15484-22176_t